jgi:hypothetical protein
MSKQSFNPAARALALLLSAAVATASVGCTGESGGASPPADAAAQLRSRLEFSSGGNHAVLDVVHDGADGVYRGTLAVTGTDGVVHQQVIEVDDAVDDDGRVPRVISNAKGERWVEVEDQRFAVREYVEHDDRVELAFAGAGDVEFRLTLYGPVHYMPAVLVLGIAGLIILCGASVVADILVCAIEDRCWDYALGSLRNICSGRCIPCAPTPTASATPTAPSPLPSATATPTPLSTPTSTPTPAVSPSPS